MSSPFHNYVRTYRKQSHLSQDEVAFLLGTTCGTKISRYERRIRLPSLRTAFAFQIILGIPAHQLFMGIFQDVERSVKNRVQQLLPKLMEDPSGEASEHKIARLRRIIKASEDNTRV